MNCKMVFTYVTTIHFVYLIVLCEPCVTPNDQKTTSTLLPSPIKSDVKVESEAEMQRKLKREYALQHLLPTKTYCGRQHWDDYFHPEPETEDTSVDEFPWLLALNNDGYCNAVLISNRYALSTPYCNFRNQLYTDHGAKVKVIVGQHKIAENISCTPTPFGDDCTSPKEYLTIDEFIDSSDFGVSLVRLKETISYTDYLRPICLPFEQNQLPKVNETITISSWGACSDTVCPENNSYKYVKKKWLLSVDISDECDVSTRKGQGGSYFPTNISSENIFCTVEIPNTTVRLSWGQYKYGRPVMYKHRSNWFLVGIVPIIDSAIRITPNVVNWILENMHDD